MIQDANNTSSKQSQAELRNQSRNGPGEELRKELRKHFRQCRNELSDNEQQAASSALATRLIEFVQEHPQINTVAVYLSNDGEPNLNKFISALWARNIRVVVPVLHPVVPGHLLFMHYTSETTMVKNKFAIEEPKLECQNIVPTADINLICLPLVAFDAQGNRLGMGGGFYDRTLEKYQDNASANPLLAGIAHDCQQASSLPTQAWDVPLNHVFTPSEHWRFSSKDSFNTDS